MLGPDYRMAYLFITPIVLLVLSLVAYPFTYAIYLSMTHKLVGLPPVFVGFENYIRLTYDGFFQRAVVNSVHLHVRLGRLQARARRGDGAGADVQYPLALRSGQACC